MSYPFRTATVKYTCLNDCQAFGGCPGHEVKVSHDKHSDGVTIESEFLPKLSVSLDGNLFSAIVMGDEALNKTTEQFVQLVKK